MITYVRAQCILNLNTYLWSAHLNQSDIEVLRYDKDTSYNATSYIDTKYHDTRDNHGRALKWSRG